MRWQLELLFQLLALLLLLPLDFQQLLLPALLQCILECFFSFSPFSPQLLLLLLQLLQLLLLLWLPLVLFPFLLPPLLDGVEPDGPRHPLRDRGSLDLLIHGAGVL